MPRQRVNHNHAQQQYYNQQQTNVIPQAHNAVPFMQGLQQPQQAHAHSVQTMQQRAADLHVQRSQGVIILSKNTSHQTTPAPTPPAPSMPSIQIPQPQLQHHQIPPAHHHATAAAAAASMSMFNPQQLQYFLPSQLMQNSLFPYYQNPGTVPNSLPPTLTPQVPTSQQQLQQQNYSSNNGAGTGSGGMGIQTINYDDFMQAPPSPIKTKSKRKSRGINQMADSSESSEEETADSEEDPEWDPSGDEDDQRRNSTQNQRGRRLSSGIGSRGGRGGRGSRGGGRGSRGGRGGARGRGRGRGGYSSPPTLIDQTAPSQLGGRQTRSGPVLNMPSLDAQTNNHQMSFGELVSQAVQSLADPDAGLEHTRHPKKRGHQQQGKVIAAVERLQNGRISLTRIPVSPNTIISLFLPVTYTDQRQDRKNPDQLALEAEDENLIMAYEIMQEEDKQRAFMCEMCGNESRSRVLHNRHLITHEPNLRSACCICSALFADHEMLKPHLRSHHGSGIFVCPDLDCEGVFQERKSLDDHEFACHPDARRFVCKYCLDRFPTESESLAHENAHGEEIDANCSKCGENFKKKSEMDQHIDDMHVEKECQFCKEKFENKPALEDHQNDKHLELIKPPTPPPPTPPPSPPAQDSDPDYNPQLDLSDGDDIVVVEERKKSPRDKPKHRGLAGAYPPPSLAKQQQRSKSEPSHRPGPKSMKKPVQPIAPKPKGSETPVPKSILKTPNSTPRRPARPVKFSSSMTSGDVITLSSDSEDEKEKDKTWRPPGHGGRRTRSMPAPSPKRPSRSNRSNEYVVIVESQKEDQEPPRPSTSKDIPPPKKSSKSSSQTLTFVMGEDGELKHVPSSGDNGGSDSLPMEDIMAIIKSKKLGDNSTIVLEDNKISSVKPGSVQQKPKIGPASKVKKPGVVTGGEKDSSTLRKLRPSSSSADIITLEDDDITITYSPPPSKSTSSLSSAKPKPSILVAKKRTGGLPSSSNKPMSSEKEDVSKPMDNKDKEKRKSVPGAIAKKRTGGSSAHYESKRKSEVEEEPIADRTKHPRKTSVHATAFDDDPLADDYPVIIEETYVESVEPLQSRLKKVIPPAPAPSKPKQVGGKRGGNKRKNSGWSSNKTHNRKEKVEKLMKKQAREMLAASSSGDFDEAPKRSLRIALKASVSDTNYDESKDLPLVNDDQGFVGGASNAKGDPLGETLRPPPPPAPAPSQKKSRGKASAAPAPPGASNDGQVVMKAFVDGVWQDVVIGTKLSDDVGPPPPNPVPMASLPPPPPPVSISKTSTARRSTGKKQQTKKPIPIPLPPSPTKFLPSGGSRAPAGRKSRGGKKKKNQIIDDPASDCWKDDRYQYYSDGMMMPLGLDPLGNTNRTHDTMGYNPNENVHADYSLGQDFAASDDTVMPFSLSSYMTYHHEHQEPDPEPEPLAEDQEEDVPVILNAYCLKEQDKSGRGAYENDPIGMSDPLQEVDEVPMTDPLAMDDEPEQEPLESQQEVEVELAGQQDSPEQDPEPEPSPEPSPPPPPPSPPVHKPEPNFVRRQNQLPRQPPPEEVKDKSGDEEEEEEESEEEEEETPVRKPPPPPEAVKKGTEQDAKSALANLRSVLSMISFKK